MRPMMTTPGQTSPPPAAASLRKPQRVLACVLCQQRKVKCDRRFPCANCIKAGAQCVPATLGPRQRRRRFPERDLLDRLRRYEDLLQQNNIKFEPLHKPAAEKASPSEDGKSIDSPSYAHSQASTVDDRRQSETTTVKSETVYEAKSIWNAMNQRSQDPEDEYDDDNEVDDDHDDDHDDDRDDIPRDRVRGATVRKAMDQLYESNDHLFFGTRKTSVNLSALHPEQVQIFRLWQIYLEKANPLLKITHTPTLQARIIDAAGNMTNISPNLEALMFSIYCISIQCLVEDECQTLFGSSRHDLLTSYHFGCQQALINCGALRSSDRDSLTAFYLYLVSVRPDTDPRSLSPMFGVVIRIAQRMRIHNEAVNAKCTAFEAEMRRRLWWSLIMFDNRISEMSDYKETTLAPTWDCKTPLNVDDSDIRPEMKSLPSSYDKPTEALFVVVRSEVGEFVRHSAFHLDFTNPSLKTIAKEAEHGLDAEGSELTNFEKALENKYLKFCNPDNPLHFMIIWTTRGVFAKNRILEHYSRFSKSVQQTDKDRDSALSYAQSVLECDTKLMASPLTKGFLWLLRIYFPMLAYMHIVHDLKSRPNAEQAEKSWEAMSNNYEARCMDVALDDNPLFKVLSKIVLQAWEAREGVFAKQNKPLALPRMVADIQRRVLSMTSNSQHTQLEQTSGFVGTSVDDSTMPFLTDFDARGFMGSGLADFHDMSGPSMMDFDVNQLDWNNMDWNPMYARGW